MSDSTKTQSVCKYCGESRNAWQHFKQNAIDGGQYHQFEPVAEPASTGEPLPCRDYFNGLSERLLNADYTAAYITAARRESEDVLIQALRDISTVWAVRPSGPWLHSHSNIEMCDDEDCKKFEEIQRVKDFDWQCGNCGFRDDPTIPGKPTICPKCGWNKWSVVSPQASPKEVAEQSTEPRKGDCINCTIDEPCSKHDVSAPQPVAGNAPKVEISTLFEEFRKRFNQFSNYIPEENRNRYLIPLLDRLQELLREADRIG